MKAESLVIADQHAAVNTIPGLVHTARHTMGVGFTRRQCSNPQGRKLTTVGSATGVKSYQVSRRGSCGGITTILRMVAEIARPRVWKSSFLRDRKRDVQAIESDSQ